MANEQLEDCDPNCDVHLEDEKRSILLNPRHGFARRKGIKAAVSSDSSAAALAR